MKICPVCKKQFDDASEFCPDDGSALEPDLNGLVGTTLDGIYYIETMLGKGGMGAVFKARHVLLGDNVAIKIMPPLIRNDPVFKRRFLREGQAARSFRHPNAIAVHDLRTADDGTIYMVLEYVEGRTLREEMKERKRFTADEALELIEPMAFALNEAHKAGIVHRDLKPENIMVPRSSEGKATVKLLDLGIAKIRSVAKSSDTAPTDITIAGQILGTPFYMSPEQWGTSEEADNSTIDGRADIYSLAIVLYEMTTGQRPFNGTLKELAVAHAAAKPPSAIEICPDLPEAFSLAVARGMAKNRSERPATCEEFVNELRSFKIIEPMPEPPRRRLRAVIAAIAILISIAIGVWIFRSPDVAPTSNRTSVPIAAPTSIETKELLNYWLEIASPIQSGPSTRTVGNVSLETGQEYKFHFVPKEHGYFYIIGPGKGNVPTTFLTEKPAAESGLKTNSSEAGADFSFPNGDLNWIQVGKDFGVDKCTVIFSTSPLKSPSFFIEKAGSSLTSEEHRALDEFRAAAFEGKKAVVGDKEPAVIINVPKSKTDGKPVVFDIEINHKQ